MQMARVYGTEAPQDPASAQQMCMSDSRIDTLTLVQRMQSAGVQGNRASCRAR